MNLWEILKTSKGLPPPDLETLLFARKISGQAVGGSTLMLTASGYPCVLEGSVGMPVLDYKIYGNSVQDGTPSPENPVEIQSVGELVTEGEFSGKYCIPVMTSGKNLLKLIDRTNFDVYGIRVDIKDGAITATGTARVSGGRTRFLSDKFILSKGTYSLSETNVDELLGYVTRISDGAALRGRIIIDKDTEVAYGINVIGGMEYNATFTPQLELGTESTPYEPYHEPITTNIYLDEPLKTDDILKYPENVLVHADGTAENITLPSIPTFDSTTIISTDTEIQPSNMEIKYKARK